MHGEFRRWLEEYEGSLIIGVAGDSGSGKTTFTKSISNLLGKELVSFFSLDDYHTEDRKTRKQTRHLPLDPSINNLELAGEHLRELRNGRAVMKPVYNHQSGKIEGPVIFEPKKIVIVEGLHTLYDELRRYIDLKIYVEPSREIKWKWKLNRDVNERGYDKSAVEEEMRKREPYYKRYIDFQKIYADIVIKIKNSLFSFDDSYMVELLLKHLDFELSGIDMHLSLTSLINNSQRAMSMAYRDDYYYEKYVSRLTFDGFMPMSAIYELEEKIKEYTGFSENYILEKEEYMNSIDIAQLLVTWYFVEMMTNIFRELGNYRR